MVLRILYTCLILADENRSPTYMTARKIGAFLASLALGACVGGAAVDSPSKPLPTLTSIKQISSLTVAEARRGYPIHIRAMVTYFDPLAPDLFVHDRTGGIWVSWSKANPIASAGQVLDLEGISAQLDFSPDISNPHWRVVGHSPPPAAKRVSFDQMTSTMEDSEWVEVEGIVRQVTHLHSNVNENLLWMDVALSGGHIIVQTPWTGASAYDLVDRRVRIRGVCGAEFNVKNQLTGVELYIPTLADITPLEPARSNLFAASPTPIAELQTYRSGQPQGHRVMLRGIVTADLPGHGLYIQDRTGAIYVETRQEIALRPGDRVETLGFPGLFDLHLRLEDAVVRRIGSDSPPQPATVTVEQIMAGTYDSELVKLRARLLGHSRTPHEITLIVEQNHTMFSVSSPADGFGRVPVEGSLLLVGGICVNEIDSLGRVTGFRLIARSARDAEVLDSPPWWTVGRAANLIGGFIVLTIVILAWVMILRRRVREQTQVIRQKLSQEESLRQAAQFANQAKSDFLANMSHEIRTPMNGIIGMTDLVLDSPLVEDQREHLETVRSCARALMTVINDILDFSKIEADKLSLDPIAFNLEDTLGEALKGLSIQAYEKNLELACQIVPDVPLELFGDAGRLRQIVVNLIGNALKFTKTGEVVLKVELETRIDSEITLHFRVMDTGIGIPYEMHSKIFDAFTQAEEGTTREFGGTGLGLAISSRLVEMFGGHLWVESEPGQGSTFHFTARFAPGIHRPAPVPKLIDIRDMPVLVVDDNATNRRILLETLSDWSMRVTLADSGIAAWVEIERAIAGGTPYPLVVLDLQMPLMDGFELTERIRRSTGAHDTKVIMLSSAGQRGDPARCKSLGIDAYLSKPVKQSDLFRSILTAFGAVTPNGSVPLSVASQSPPEASYRVLVAEDSLVNQRLAARLLEKRGHTVVIANNGSEAVDALDRERFDVVLMDVQMPVMDGFQATALIREKEKSNGEHIRIIALTAYAMKGDRERCLAAGMDGYICKPIDPAELYAAISGAGQGSRASTSMIASH